MSKFMESKQAFSDSKAVRYMVYLAAFVMTIINFATINMVAAGHSGGLAYLMLGLTIITTLALYLISDGISAFAVLVKIAMKVGGVFTAVISFLFCWMMFIGTFFAVLMSFLAEAAIIAGALYLAYMLPIIFIPVCHLLTRFAGYVSRKAADHKQADSCTADYETVQLM